MNFFIIFRATFHFSIWFNLKICWMLRKGWNCNGIFVFTLLFFFSPYIIYVFRLFVCIFIVCRVLNGKPLWFVGYLYADVVGSAIGFTIFAAILCSWALTFSIGGERLFGPVWDELVMYNLADRLGLVGWS
jgi:hypothetical protein